MKMEVSILPISFLVTVLITFSVKSNGEFPYRKVLVSPRVKLFNSNGDVHLTPLLGHSRIARKINACKFPTVLSDYQLDCKLYPTRVHCTQTCMFGYTLSDAIKREMKCKYDENKWEPVPEFENCRPFIDCGVTLGPGGKYKCYTNYMDKGTECEISCDHYEDKAAVPTKSYTCDINGKWNPKLPFCAKAGTGLKLVPPPKGPKSISRDELYN